MDIILPFSADRLNGLELKYAIRSIRKHLTGFDGIYIIGDRPKEDGIIHIQATDVPGRKEKSICDKILKACDLFEISENFIMWHDDHILLKPLDVSQIKAWHNGPLSNELKRSHSGYRQTVQNTLNFWEEDYQPHILNFDIHTPCVFNKEAFKYINTPDIWQREMCIKSLYFNYLNEPGEFMADLKINQSGLSKEKILAAIGDRLFLSTGPMAMEPPLTEILETLFPDQV